MCYFFIQLNASAGGGSSETEAVSVPSTLGDSLGAQAHGRHRVQQRLMRWRVPAMVGESQPKVLMLALLPQILLLIHQIRSEAWD